MATRRQEQSIEPSPRNEVIIPGQNPAPNLDHDLPITLRKELENAKKSRYIHCLTLCIF